MRTIHDTSESRDFAIVERGSAEPAEPLFLYLERC